MYGRSPLSVVVVCDLITVRLNVCLPVKHWRWYSVITPSGSSGGPQLSLIDVELMGEAENDVGVVFGPVLCTR